MSGPALPKGAHCRICGSINLNIAHYAIDQPDRFDLYQALVRSNAADQLIRPCNCRGNFAFAHKVCLSEWIETTKHEFCDICRFKYNVSFYERTIFEWASEGQQVARILRALCLSAFVYYICALGVLNHLLSRRAQTNAVSVMVFASSCVWFVFSTVGLVVFALQLVVEYSGWRQANRRVLVDENKEPLLDSQPSPKDILKSSGFKPK